MTDEALMAAYVAGDGRAFDTLFARMAPQLHGFFVRTFRSGAIADDLLQTTFLKLHRARRQFQPDRRLKPWLYAIATRVKIDQLRAVHGLKENAGDDEVAAALDAQVSANSRAVADEADVAAVVRAALDRLPESQRAVVILHRYQGLTFAEIAEALGSTEGAIKLRAFRAYEALRKDLAGLAEAA